MWKIVFASWRFWRIKMVILSTFTFPFFIPSTQPWLSYFKTFFVCILLPKIEVFDICAQTTKVRCCNLFYCFCGVEPFQFLRNLMGFTSNWTLHCIYQPSSFNSGSNGVQRCTAITLRFHVLDKICSTCIIVCWLNLHEGKSTRLRSFNLAVIFCINLINIGSNLE